MEKKNSVQAGSPRAKRTVLRRITTFLAAIAVFLTTYALILPAITMEAAVFCNLEAHSHGDACFTSERICGYEEGEIIYQEQTVQHLICQNEDPDHVHDDSCYKDVLEQVETGVHQHNDDCYERALT